MCAAALALATSAGADEPLSPAERAKLEKQADELNQLLLQLYGSGKPAQAIRLARQALEIRVRLYPATDYPDGHPDLAASFSNLGSVLLMLGQPPRALAYFEKALAINEHLYPPNKFKDGHPDLATSLNNLGAVLEALGQPAKALPYYEKALAMYERLYPPDKFTDGHCNLANALNNLGFVLQALRQPARALPYSEKALAMRERLYPLDKFKDGHPDLALSLNNLGYVLQALGQPAKALPYYEKALAMYDRLYPPDKFKDGHPNLANCLNNLGLLLKALGQPANALPYSEKALAMRERLYPPDKFKDGHPDLAESLDSLGVVLNALGQPAKALACYEKALAMRERLYPPDKFKDGHPKLAISLNELGSVLEALGQPAKALLYFEKALRMRESLYPPDKFKDGHPDLALSLNNLGVILNALGQPAKALACYEKALTMDERLYPPDKFKDGHPDLALSLNNLGVVLNALGQPAKALPYCEKALAMRERLYPDKFKHGHPELAISLNALGNVLEALGQPDKALQYFEKALAMRERLYPPDKFKDGHPELATSLSNLGAALEALEEPDKALQYFEKALAMRERLYPPHKFKDGHPELAMSLNSLGFGLQALGQPGKALQYFEKALAMRECLYPPDKFKDGHPDLAMSLNNLGVVLNALGQPATALPYYEKALAMSERLYPPEKFKDGHPFLVKCHHNVGFVLEALRGPARALPNYKKAVAINVHWAAKETAGAPEAQALVILRSLPKTRDAYLLAALHVPGEPVPEVYAHVWPSKGLLLQLAARRHQAVLVATSDSPKTRRQWEQLLAVRGQLNRLAVEPGNDLAVRDRRLADLTDEQEMLERELAKQLPELDRHRRLATLGPPDLAQKLRPGTAFIDFVRHAHWEKGKFTGYRYQAFVLAPGRPVRRVDLGPAQRLDYAVASWRRAIDRNETSLAPQKLKEQVWDILAAELPPGTKAVYLCPEGDLTRLPWTALPGSKTGTVLLEDLALAVVPSGSWLLEQLIYSKQDANGPDTLVVAGAIDYGMPAGAKAAYAPLGGTNRELERVLEAFGSGEGAALRQQAATSVALKERLPKARYAHLATHAYFDEPGLAAERRRAREQLEKWAYHADQPTERVGLGAKNPLGYVGLALAGANDPTKAGPDGGILTGLGVVNLRLENLRLCVLSACETGLGDLTEGEGMVGLQRAFHVAGCPNVVGSLWTVDDAATAALMAQFYHELCVNKQSPLEALRAAQLTIYRHPERIPELAGERGKPALNAAAKLGPAAGSNEKLANAPTRLWAAFVLSGVGR
jgi:tetratricopeptide (TPR) repeat protein